MDLLGQDLISGAGASSNRSASPNLFHSNPTAGLDLSALYASPTPQQQQLHRQHSAFLAQAGLQPIQHPSSQVCVCVW